MLTIAPAIVSNSRLALASRRHDQIQPECVSRPLERDASPGRAAEFFFAGIPPDARPPQSTTSVSRIQIKAPGLLSRKSSSSSPSILKMVPSATAVSESSCLSRFSKP